MPGGSRPRGRLVPTAKPARVPLRWGWGEPWEESQPVEHRKATLADRGLTRGRGGEPTITSACSTHRSWPARGCHLLFPFPCFKWTLSLSPAPPPSWLHIGYAVGGTFIPSWDHEEYIYPDLGGRVFHRLLISPVGKRSEQHGFLSSRDTSEVVYMGRRGCVSWAAKWLWSLSSVCLPPTPDPLVTALNPWPRRKAQKPG